MTLGSRDYARMMQANPRMIQNVPPSPGISAPWSGSQNLGNEISFAPDANNRQNILKLDEWGPPEIWTLSLGITYGKFGNATPIGSKFPGLDVTAEISFGAGGSTQRVDISWLDGTRISLPMNAVSVTAKYNFDVIETVGNTLVPPDDLRLTAQLARGYSSGNPVLANAVLLYPGNSYDDYVTVPKFAKSFRVIPGTLSEQNSVNITTAAKYVWYTGYTPGFGFPQPALGTLTASGIINYEQPIPPGGRIIRVVNSGAATTLDAIFIWNICG